MPFPINNRSGHELLVVSQDLALSRLLWSIGREHDWKVEIATTGWSALEMLDAGAQPELIVLDLPRSAPDNLYMLQWLRRFRSELQVLAVCENEDLEIRSEAVRMGAGGLLLRPIDQQRLESTLLLHLGDGLASLNDIVEGRYSHSDEQIFHVGSSPVSRKFCAQAELLAQADVPVFIAGEAGCGKEAAARLVHKLAGKSGNTFRKLNCALIPEELLEQGLFGERQLYPRLAESSRNAGPAPDERRTIFLEEISELPERLQVRLLEKLQEIEAAAADEQSPRSTMPRILAANGANPEAASSEKKLRRDFYYRLTAFTLRVPPLRERKEEIPELLRYSMTKLARYYGIPAREFSTSMLSACQTYSWPMNLAELDAFAERYLVSGDTNLLPGPPDSTPARRDSENQPRVISEAWAEFGTLDQSSHEDVQNGEPKAPQSLKAFVHDVKSQAEKTAIVAALEKTGWNRKAASRLLQVSYRTLLYKIEQYRMKAPGSNGNVGAAPAPRIQEAFGHQESRGSGD
ncbi:MAG TPA: sigma 54-interacting transcriptional regulator [Candidatus Sulfotelmatobacter sp.]|nr:sigma 54-interacting transcriptional regulator [Candidatus Sulfotelmatobacter sp.]